MNKKTRTSKMGRPPLPPDKRRGASMGFRPTPTVRAKLKQAAQANGRSMSQEVESRLEASFLKEEAKFEEFGSEGKYTFMKLLAAAVRVVEHRLGKSFDEDPYVRSQSFLALKELLEFYSTKEAGLASEEGHGVLHGDKPVGKEIGFELKRRALAQLFDQMKTGEMGG